jgi:glycosyltransferase involved in cell wall biosynthesis
VAVVRVALDLTALRSGDTGVAHYATELHAHLRSDHPDVELRTFSVGRGPVPPVAVDRHVPVPLRAVHLLWATVRLPRAEHLVGPVDVVHATDMVPAPTAAATVVTVHDVLSLRRPELYGPRSVRIARAQLAAARRADLVLTTCRATADDIAAAGVDAARIEVAPLGHRPVPDPLPPPLIDGPYVLHVGARTPRKGLATLAAAHARLGPSAPALVAAGPDGWRASEVDTGGARLLGRVTDDELTSLYAHAAVVCHPSEAEGFGMPVLEAMAFGIPVVAADIPPVREIAGGVARLVPPGDVEALADALTGALGSDGTAGVERATGYTWSACAAATAQTYRRVR